MCFQCKQYIIDKATLFSYTVNFMKDLMKIKKISSILFSPMCSSYEMTSWFLLIARKDLFLFTPFYAFYALSFCAFLCMFLYMDNMLVFCLCFLSPRLVSWSQKGGQRKENIESMSKWHLRENYIRNINDFQHRCSQIWYKCPYNKGYKRKIHKLCNN